MVLLANPMVRRLRRAIVAFAHSVGRLNADVPPDTYRFPFF
jgi:hypothetical protein